MDICVISAVGTGKTRLLAFDQALHNAGVRDYRLIPMRSAGPMAANIAKCDSYLTGRGHGSCLYLIRAAIQTTDPRQVVATGLGWYAKDDGDLIAEHEVQAGTRQEAEAELKYEIGSSLRDCCVSRGVAFDRTRMDWSFALCEASSSSVCALTIAVACPHVKRGVD